MHNTGLYTINQMPPVNELRMKARAKAGRALASIERAAGPGRG
jgi:hypothetical protein